MDDWDALREPLVAACEEPTDEERIRHAVDAAELVAATSGEPPDDLVELACRSMKQVANANEWWRERLQDLRYRLGDVAAP